MSTKGDRWPLIDEAVFRTLTSEDWRKGLARAQSLQQ